MTYDDVMALTGGKPMAEQQQEATEEWAESVDATLDSLQDSEFQTNQKVARLEAELTKLKDVVYASGIAKDRTDLMPQSMFGKLTKDEEHHAQLFGGSDDGEGQRSEG